MIAVMEKELFKFWRDPLKWVDRKCDELDVPLYTVVEDEGGVSTILWRKWCRGVAQPSFKKFAGIMRAIEKRERARMKASLAAQQKETDSYGATEEG